MISGLCLEVAPSADEHWRQENCDTDDGEHRGGRGGRQLARFTTHVVEDDPAERCGVRLGPEADDGLKHAEIIHQLDQRDKGDQRHKVRDDDMADLLPTGCAVDLRRLQRILRDGLKAGVKHNESKRCRRPDSVDDERYPSLLSFFYVTVHSSEEHRLKQAESSVFPQSLSHCLEKGLIFSILEILPVSLLIECCHQGMK